MLSFGSKRRRFPLLSYRGCKKKGGLRHYSDDIEECKDKDIYVTKFELEDCLTFYPGFEYRIVEGVYYDEGRNTKIAELMKKV